MLSSILLCALLAMLAEAGPTTRVVNGIVAEPNSWPSQLSLQLDNSHICGAVVLNENFALTAAHCVDFAGYDTSRFSVVCGAHDILNPDSNWQMSVAADIRMHEDYNANTNGFPNDIAVIRLATPLRLSSTCQAAQLPPDSSKDYANKASTITGWGRTSGAGHGDSGGPLYSPDYSTGQLTVTGVTSFGRSGCDTSYPSVYTRVSSYLGWIDSTMSSM